MCSSFQNVPTPQKLAALFLAAATIASCGCGGGSGSTSIVTTANTSLPINFASVPAVVAEKIGDGSWAAATPEGSTLTLSLPPEVNSYGIAYICPLALGSYESITEATVADNLTSVPGCPNGVPTTASLSGSVDASAISGVGQIVVDAAGGIQILAGNAGTFAVTAQTGTDDIAFLAEDLSGNLLGVKILRSQTVPGVLNNGNAVSFSASDATTFEPLTATNIPPGFNIELPGMASYSTANGTNFALNNVAGTQYAVVPSSEAQATDDYRFSVSYAEPHSLVLSELTATSAGAISLALPVALSYSAPAPGPFPAFSFNYSGTGVNDYYLNLFWENPQGDGLSSIVVRATVAYQAGATSLAVPDLSSIPGFLAPAGSGALMNWSASVVGGTTGQPGGSDAIWNAEIFGSYIEP